VQLEGLDYSAYRDDAIVIEGRPGDVFYWPAEYWHVAESDGELCVSIGLGLFREATPLRFVEQAAAELAQERAPAIETHFVHPSFARGALAEVTEGLRRALGGASLMQRVKEKILAHATSFGYLATPEPRGAGGVPSEALCCAPVPGSIAAEVDGDTLLFAVNGAVFHYPAASAIFALLEVAASGALLDVEETCAALADDEVDADVLRHVLDVLWRHHALVPA